MADLPTEGWIVVVVCGVAGILLWAFGGKILKSAIVLSGAILGASAGFVVAEVLIVPIPPWTLSLGGAAIIGVLAWMAYRPAMGLCLAILIGTAAPVGVLAYAEYRGIDVFDTSTEADAGEETTDNVETTGGNETTDSEIETDVFEAFLDGYNLMKKSDNPFEDFRRFVSNRGNSLLTGEEDQPTEDIEAESTEENPDSAPVWMEIYSEVVEELKAEIIRRWEYAPAGVRRSLVLSCISGAILGLLIGLSLPGVAASLITALAGSAMILSSGFTALNTIGIAEQSWLPSTATVWLIVWFGASIAGMAIQWTIRRKPADSSS